MGAEHQAPVAFGAGQAYLRSIEPIYAQLQARVRERNNGGTRPMTENPGEIAPLVSAIAFAIELLLKVLQIQERGAASRGHDLGELWKPLSEETKRNIERRYPASLDAWIQKHELPFILINASGNPNPSFDGAPATTCADALARLGRAFEHWRYMYELMLNGGTLYFNFAEAFAAVDAIRAEILQFQGNAVVNMNIA
jgi:HEPN domain-containing protein